MSDNRDDLLIELGVEELPPKLIGKLSSSLVNALKVELEKLGLEFDSIEPYAAPRRLAAIVKQLSAAQADQTIERQGPAVAAAFDGDGNPTPAASGFARSCGVEVADLKRVETDKGERLAYTLNQPGKQLSDLIGSVLISVIKALPVPKPMRWGANSHQFIRPVHWLVVLHGERVLPAELMGQKSDRISYGHRFMAPDAIELGSPGDYASALEKAFVIVDAKRRKELIREQVETAGYQAGGRAVIDEDLLDEVTGVVDWPVALTGRFDETFLEVPSEALVSSMSEHQKYFHARDDKGELLPLFITVSNIQSTNPQSVIGGNERVIRPRLADAKFFFETDKKQSLESRQAALQKVTFQKQLGSVQDKAERVANLAVSIAHSIGGDAKLCKRAGQLSKCDLATEMVGEFPGLQGLMGRYYAIHDGEPAEVAAAMAEQYLPRYSKDSLAETKTGQALAVADRIDTLVGIFGIGQPPTGTKDPFGLRRAAIGMLRTIIEQRLTLDLKPLIETARGNFGDQLSNQNVVTDLLEFILERFRAYYQEQGTAVDSIQAVQALAPTSPLDFDRRLQAVEYFKSLPEAQALAAANKRVKNILAKSETPVGTQVDASLLTETAEKALFEKIQVLETNLRPSIAAGEYDKILSALAALREPIDTFFDDVMVNAEDPAIKNNRLALLAKIRGLFNSVADVSVLQATS